MTAATIGVAFYDHLEIRDPEQRELAQFNLLGDFIRRAQTEAPGWAAQLRGVDAGSITSRAGLASLPILRKAQLKELQARMPPFGGIRGRAGHPDGADFHVAGADLRA